MYKTAQPVMRIEDTALLKSICVPLTVAGRKRALDNYNSQILEQTQPPSPSVDKISGMKEKWEGFYILRYATKLHKENHVSLDAAFIKNGLGDNALDRLRNVVSDAFSEERSWNYFKSFADAQDISLVACLLDFLQFCQEKGYELEAYRKEEKAFNNKIEDLKRYIYPTPIPLGLSAPGESPGDTTLPGNPYKGFSTFKPEDADDFFGRDLEIEKIKQHFATRNFLALTGASGSGKSSLMFAGVLPEMQKNGWQYESIRLLGGNENRPLSKLAHSILRLKVEGKYISELSFKIADIVHQLTESPASLSLLIEDLLCVSSDKKVIFYIDQFEELFSPDVNKTEKESFICALAAFCDPKLKRSIVNAVFVVSLRSDYLHEINSDLRLSEIFAHTNTLTIFPLTKEGLREAIIKPAQRHGVAYEEKLPESILKDVISSSTSLTLLEFALKALWSTQVNKEIKHTAYQRIGNVSRVFADRVDQLYGELTVEEQTNFEYLFIMLIGERDGAIYTKKVVLKADIEPKYYSLIEKLSQEPYRFIVTKVEPQSDEITIEIVHERLISEWRLLNDWAVKYQGFLAWQNELIILARQWFKNSVKSNLLQGDALEIANKNVSLYDGLLSQKLTQFIQQSVKTDNKRKLDALMREKHENLSEGNKVNNIILKGKDTPLILLTIVLCLLFLAYKFYSEKQQLLRFQSQNIASTARTLIENGNFETALLLSLNALPGLYGGSRPVTEEANEALMVAVANQSKRLVLPHDKSLNHLQYSNDGTLMLSASKDGDITLWRTINGTQKHFWQHRQKLKKVELSPNGEYVLTVEEGQSQSVLWSVETGSALYSFKQSSSVIDSIFSLDGSLVANASADNKVVIWSVHTGQPLQTIKCDSKITEIAFNANTALLAISTKHSYLIWSVKQQKLIRELPKETRQSNISIDYHNQFAATSSYRNAVSIWSLTSGEELYRTLHNSEVKNMQTSPDGKYLVTVRGDNSIHIALVNDQTDTKIIRLDDTIQKIDISQNDQFLMTISEARKTIIWSLKSGRKLKTITSDFQPLRAVFDPVKAEFAIATSNGDASIWRTNFESPYVKLRHNAKIVKVAFHPKGNKIATASVDNKAIIWSIKSGKPLATFKHNAKINDLTFSPDGNALLTASDDSFSKLWSLSSSGADYELLHESEVTSASFTANGNLIRTTSKDEGITLWSVKSGEKIKSIQRSYPEKETVFSSDNEYAFSILENNSAEFRKLGTGELIFSLNATQLLQNAAISPDNSLIVAASDSRVIAWRFTTGEIFRKLDHDSNVRNVMFSPEGKYLLTITSSNIANIWSMEEGRPKYTIRSHQRILNASISSNESYLAISASSSIGIWSLVTGRLVQQFFSDSRLPPNAFSPNGRFIATGIGDDEISIWAIIQPSTIDEAINTIPKHGKKCLTPQDRKKFFLPKLSKDAWFERGCPEHYAENYRQN